MRRAAALAAAAALALAGCGGVSAADFFEVTRVGPGGSRLSLVINEEGVVRCEGRASGHLSDSQLVAARTIQEELAEPAAKGLALAARTGSVYSYTVRDQDGTVRFADNSASPPKVLQQLQLLVLQVAHERCGLSQ